MSDTSIKPKVPASALPRLRDQWMQANGAAQAAEASGQVARSMFSQYQGSLGTILEMLGLDPKQQWFVDFTTGDISDKDPTQQNGVNGVMRQPGN